MTAISELIRQLRTGRGVSLSQLAERAQIARRTLSYWEAGTYLPRLPELKNLLTALEATAEQHAQAIASLTAPRGIQELRLSSEHLQHENHFGVMPSGGDLLRALRQRSGLHLEQVAGMMNISTSTLSRWENGKVVPPPDRLDVLLETLGAQEAEQNTLKDGYLFLIAPQQEAALSPFDLQERFHAFFISMFGNREDKLNDLRFLSFEAQAWALATKDERGREILAAICANYAAFLADFNRMDEAYRYAHRTLDLLAHRSASEEILLRAAIVAARTEVYRGARPLPKRGLKMLQGWLSADALPEFQAWMLSEMAGYLMLENDWDAALRLRQEACRIAERCHNPSELRLRKLDLAKVEVEVGDAEHALSLVELVPRDTPFRRADIELLFAEGLVKLEERRNAEVWLERATADIRTYDLTHLHQRVDILVKQL